VFGKNVPRLKVEKTLESEFIKESQNIQQDCLTGLPSELIEWNDVII
jgi:hypothetical protein